MGYAILPSLLSPLRSLRAQRARGDGIATASCPSYSSSALTTDLDKGNLKEKGLLLAHGLKVEESWQQELAATGHFASEVRKQGPRMPVFIIHSVRSKNQAQGIMLTSFKAVLPTSSNLIEIIRSRGSPNQN